MEAHVMILANDEWLTVKFTPDLETGQSFSNCRCKLARARKKADAEETPDNRFLIHVSTQGLTIILKGYVLDR